MGDITAPHHVMSTTYIRHDVYQPLFPQSGPAMHITGGIVLRTNRASSQWKYMAVGRTCPKDHCSDASMQAPGTCTGDKNPETEPRPAHCCDRAYGQAYGGNEEEQWTHFTADIHSMVKVQRGKVYNPQWNEVHGLGISATDIMGVFYPLDGYHSLTKWDDGTV